jgi:hypothetical protein
MQQIFTLMGNWFNGKDLCKCLGGIGFDPHATFCFDLPYLKMAMALQLNLRFAFIIRFIQELKNKTLIFCSIIYKLGFYNLIFNV